MSSRAVALTRRGWTVAGAAAGLLLAGRLLGADELTVLGLAALGVLVGACGWALCTRRALRIERRVEPTRLHVGDAARADLVVTATRPSPAVDLVEAVDGDRLRAAFPLAPLASGDVAEAPYRVPTDHRGALALGPTTVERTDPLGLASVRRPVADADTVLVRPRVHPIGIPNRGAGMRAMTDDDTATRAPTADAGGEFFAVRPYEVGDDPRRVHWRSSARTDELVVRQFVAPRRGRTLVVLDTRDAGAPSPPSPDAPSGPPHRDPAFEHAVEATASLVTALGRAGRPVECITTGGAVLAPAGCDTRRAMDRLATVAMDEPDLLQAVAARRARESAELVVIVTARADSAVHAAHRLLASRMPAMLVATGGAPPEHAAGTVVDARTIAFADAWRAAHSLRSSPLLRARRTAGMRTSWTSAEPSRPASPSPR